MNLEKIYFKILFGGFIFIVAVLPFVISPVTFFPDNFAKGILFRIVVELLLVIYILLAISDKKYQPSLSVLDILILSFWLIMGLATIFSVQPLYSLLGGTSRMGGFFTFSHYVAFYFILKGTLKEKKQWLLLLKLAVISCGILSIFILAQKLEISPLNQIYPPKFSIYESMTILGNRNFLAAYLLLFFPFSLIFIFYEWRKIPKSIKEFILFLITTSLILGAIIVVGSRGTYLGTLIAIAWLSLFFLRWGLWPFLKRCAISGSIWPQKSFLFKMVIVSIGFLLISSSLFIGIQLSGELIKKTHLNTSFANLIQNTDKTRIVLWQMSFQALKEKPILGYGPENFQIVFDKYSSGEYFGFLYPTIAENWISKAHNFLFETGVNTGFAGLLLLLSILGYLFYKLSRRKNETLIILGLQATFLAYFTQNFFNIDTVMSYLFFFFFLAFTEFLTPQKIQLPSLSINKHLLEKRQCFTIGCLALLILFISFMLYFLNVKPLLANQKINKIVHSSNSISLDFDIRKALAYYQIHYPQILNEAKWLSYDGTIISFLSFTDLYGKELERQRNLEKAEEIYRETIELLERQKRVQPHDAKICLFLGEFYTKLIPYDENARELAHQSYQEAIRLKPAYQEAHIKLGTLSIINHDYLLAFQYFKKAYLLKQNDESSWWLGVSYILNNKPETAQKYLKESNKLNVEHPESFQYLASIYLKNKDYKYLIELHKSWLEISPYSTEWRASLAALYKELGQYKKAREEALKLFETYLTPDAKANVENFLRSLPE